MKLHEFRIFAASLGETVIVSVLNDGLYLFKSRLNVDVFGLKLKFQI